MGRPEKTSRFTYCALESATIFKESVNLCEAVKPLQFGTLEQTR